MAIKFDLIKAGDVVYSRQRRQMGNTMMRETCEYEVKVYEIDYENRRAVVSWNGNARETWHAGRLAKCYKKPMPKKEPRWLR